MAHTSEDLPRPTMIICDDDQVTRKLVRGVAERFGFEVLAGVNNAIDALNLVLEHQPDVLVLDLVLPGMSGEEIISAIQDSSHTKVIVHTAYDPRLAVKSGARFFATKGNLGMLERVLTRAMAAEVTA